ncbi:MAG: hypothetical protein ABR981_03580 [Candidatus Micrarchaeaceae archaeon]
MEKQAKSKPKQKVKVFLGRKIFLEEEPYKSKRHKITSRVQYQRLKAEYETGTKIKELINEIDFKTLKKLFSEEYERAGLDPQGMNFVGPRHIYSNAGWSNAGSYYPGPNVIGVDVGHTESYYTNDQFDKKILLLHILFHEEAHAVEKVECHIGEKEDKDYNNMGYEKQKLEKNPKGHSSNIVKRYFELFSEGVTDKLAMEITEKYIDIKNLAKEDEVIKFKRDLRTKGPYWFNQHIVDVFISKLSRSSGISPKVVWEAIKTGALRGDNLYSGELREFLDSEVGAEFMDSLENNRFITKKVTHERSKSEQLLRNAKYIVLRLVRNLNVGKFDEVRP